VLQLPRVQDARGSDNGAEGRKGMTLNQGKVAGGLVNELLELIHKYDESLYMATVIGCLELVKQQLINDSIEGDDE
jgi:hypothetical protein